MSLFVGWRHAVLGIQPREAEFSRRGFVAANEAAKYRLETIGKTFIAGYDTALANTAVETVCAQLQSVEPVLQGFSFEGAAMGLMLLDHLSWKRPWRIERFLQCAGDSHPYMIHVGIGWAVARLPWLRWRIANVLEMRDPLLRWLVIDGLGFHEGYFHWRRSIERQQYPRYLSGYALRCFDQGLGRSLWFVHCADAARTASVVSRFSTSRQQDLWAGIGLACTYAGGAGKEEIERLLNSARDYRPWLAQGAAFAAKTRMRADNPTENTDLACQLICSVSSQRAAAITDECLEGALTAEGEGVFAEPYEIWRRRIADRM